MNKIKQTNKEQQIKRWFKDQCLPDGLSCPFCMKSDWLLFEGIWIIPPIPGVRLAIYKKDANIPIIVLMCDSCGYMAQFNAKKIGIIDE